MHAFWEGPSTIHHEYYHDSHDEVTRPSCSQLWSNLSVRFLGQLPSPLQGILWSLFLSTALSPFFWFLACCCCLRVFYVFAHAFPLLLASVKGNLAFIEAGSTSPEKEFSRISHTGSLFPLNHPSLPLLWLSWRWPSPRPAAHWLREGVHRELTKANEAPGPPGGRRHPESSRAPEPCAGLFLSPGHH